MKKSTILLLAVVYIVSFFIIGLLGHSVRSYNPKVEPESIVLSDPDNRTEMTLNILEDDKKKIKYNYYFVCWNYVDGIKVRIKATVKPDNTSWPNVTFVKDSQDTSFNLDTHETNPDIEEGFAVLSLNETVDWTNIAVSAPFTVISQNPGTQIKIRACVTFSVLPPLDL